MISSRSTFTRALIVAVAAVVLAAGHAEARAGRGGFGFGSRGARTFQAPPPTSTAPTPAAPIQRSTTPQPGPTAAQNAPRPGIAQAARPGFFSTRGGFLGGLVGAGLLGMLLGYGLFGGLGGLASILGLLLQVLLVVFLARMAFHGSSAATSQPMPAPGAARFRARRCAVSRPAKPIAVAAGRAAATSCGSAKPTSTSSSARWPKSRPPMPPRT